MYVIAYTIVQYNVHIYLGVLTLCFCPTCYQEANIQSLHKVTYPKPLVMPKRHNKNRMDL